MGVLRAYGLQMPRLQARDSLLMVERLGVGTGAVKASDSRAQLRKWRTEAAIDTSAKKAGKAMPVDALRKMGTAFKRVPATRKQGNTVG